MNARELKIFLLRALNNYGSANPMPETVLKDSLRLAANGMTDFDLDQLIESCESADWIAGTNDELLGRVWMLTPKGKLQLAKLR